MRSIEEMYAAGDFDAIRQMLDEEEARAEQKLREAEEKARAEKEKKVAEARANLLSAVKVYTEVLECPMDEKSMVRMVKSLCSLESFADKCGAHPMMLGGRPSITIKGADIDDEVLHNFLRGL